MSGLLYFIAGARGRLTDRKLIDLGLGHALEKGGTAQAELRAGPDGLEGVLVRFDSGPAAEAMPCRFEADQVWKKMVGKEHGQVAHATPEHGQDARATPEHGQDAHVTYLGWVKDAPPGPGELRRGVVYDGESVELRDGHRWVIPRAHAVLEDRPTTLPQVLELDEAGNWVGRPEERFAGICADAWKIWEMFQAGAGMSLPAAEAIRIAVAALACNYRVSAAEVSALGLLNTSHLDAIFAALIDAGEVLARAVAIQKKKDSPAGDGAST